MLTNRTDHTLGTSCNPYEIGLHNDLVTFPDHWNADLCYSNVSPGQHRYPLAVSLSYSECGERFGPRVMSQRVV